MGHVAGSDPDAAAFADHDLAAWLATAPASVRNLVEKEMIRRGGLRAFTPLAWSSAEGGTFQNNWHIDAVLEHMQAVVLGEITRLIIMMPPRHMKSVGTAVMAPAWSWTVNPSLNWLFASYAFNLAVRDSRKCRKVIQSRWYQALFGDRFRLLGDQNTKTRYENDKHGSRLSTSVRGQLTGEGADIIVVDDPHNVLEAESEKKRTEVHTWWDESMMSRLNDQRTGRKVLVQQRVHSLDLAGHVMAKDGHAEEQFREGWHILCLPAEFQPDHPQRWFRDPRTEVGQLLWPERMGPRELGKLKIGLGPYAAAAQLQQLPAPREGGIFKRHWFRPWTGPVPLDMRWIRGWDLASSIKKRTKTDPDATASVLVGWSASQKCWIIGDATRCQEDAGEVRRVIEATAADDDARWGDVAQELPQDPGQAGKAQAQDMVRALAGHRVRASPVQGDKGVRAEPVAAQAQMGHIRYVVGPWNDPFFAELTGFPTAPHDDYVDALSGAFLRLTGGRRGIMDFYAEALQEAAEEAQAAVGGDQRQHYGVARTRLTTDIGDAPSSAEP